MIVEFDEELRKKTIAFCDDNLDCDINYSHHVEDYHDEILAQIEILLLLDKADMARKYAYEYGNHILDNVKLQQDLHKLLNKYSTEV